MTYRTRVEGAILTGTPPLRAMLWAIAVHRAGHGASRSPRYVGPGNRAGRAALAAQQLLADRRDP